MKELVLLSKLFEPGRSLLPPDIHVTECYTDEPETRLDILERADVILLGNQKFPGTLIDRLPRLKVLAKQGSGYDNIDVAAAGRRGIPVVLSAGANANSVAEHVMMLILAVNKRLTAYDHSARSGDFSARSRCEAREIKGKRLGLVGCGSIGKLVGTFAKGMGMEILSYDPYLPKQEAAALGFQSCRTLEELLEQSDTVSVHVPLNDSTRHMIGRKELRRMKDGAVLVNCSRGGTVDETALLEALTSKKLWGAGIDVYEEEPAKAENPLFALSNVIATPHSAALTQESAAGMSSMTIEGILDVLNQRPCRMAANPEVFAMAGWQQKGE